MSLKSSEIKNFSWSISTVLESLLNLLLSPAKHTFHLPSDPWRECVCELVLKIFLHSPEMNRSVFFSMHLLSVTEKIRYFLRYLVFGERIFPWFNPILFFQWKRFWWRRQASSLLCGFAFAFGKHAKSLAFSFTGYYSSWSSWNFCSIVVQISQTYLIHDETSDPRVTYCLFSHDTILISTPYLPCK